MRFFTFDSATPNLGRSTAWTVRAEAKRQAQAGSLASIILRDGYGKLPVHVCTIIKNIDGDTLASLCAEVVAGLEERKTESGTVQPILNGTSITLFIRRMQDIQDRRAAGIIVDGHCRTIASIIAYGCGREDVDMRGEEIDEAGEAALGSNIAIALANKLDPWAKVQGAQRIMSMAPSITESEMMKAVGCKRGDGQLMHRAASAVQKHGLTADMTKRCPSKEEWKEILEEKTAAGAAALLLSMQSDVREKALGWDMVSKALEKLPEGSAVDTRKLAACKDRAQLDALMLELSK